MNRGNADEIIRSKWVQWESQTPVKDISAQELWNRLNNRSSYNYNRIFSLATAAAIISIIVTGIALLPKSNVPDSYFAAPYIDTNSNEVDITPERMCIDVNITDPMYSDVNNLYPACMIAISTEQQTNN